MPAIDPNILNSLPILHKVIGTKKNITETELLEVIEQNKDSLAQANVDVSLLRTSSLPNLLAAINSQPILPLAREDSTTEKQVAQEPEKKATLTTWGRRGLIAICSFLGVKNLFSSESGWLRPILYFAGAAGLYGIGKASSSPTAST